MRRLMRSIYQALSRLWSRLRRRPSPSRSIQELRAALAADPLAYLTPEEVSRLWGGRTSSRH